MPRPNWEVMHDPRPGDVLKGPSVMIEVLSIVVGASGTESVTLRGKGTAVPQPWSQPFVKTIENYRRFVDLPTTQVLHASEPADAFESAVARQQALLEAHRRICSAAVQAEDQGKIYTWSDAATLVVDLASATA